MLRLLTTAFICSLSISHNLHAEEALNSVVAPSIFGGSSDTNSPVGSIIYDPSVESFYGLSDTAADGWVKLGTTGSSSVKLVSSGTYAYTIEAGVEVVIVTTDSSSDTTVTLPAATAAGRRVVIKKVGTGTNDLVIQRAGSDTIDGQTSFELRLGDGSSQDSVEFVADGVSTWNILTSSITEYEQETGTNFTSISSTLANVDTITLQPGKWEVSANIQFKDGEATRVAFALDDTSGCTSAVDGQNKIDISFDTNQSPFSAIGDFGSSISPIRFDDVSASQTIYLCASVTDDNTDIDGWSILAKRIQ